MLLLNLSRFTFSRYFPARSQPIRRSGMRSFEKELQDAVETGGGFLVLDGQRKFQTESSWLTRSGFSNIATQKIGNGFSLISGQRPLHTF